jgi:hypothetical protein
LAFFAEPPSNTALRIFGRLFHELVVEHYYHWPNWPEGVTATELRAALADLRHLEGYLAAVGRGAPGRFSLGAGHRSLPLCRSSRGRAVPGR